MLPGLLVIPNIYAASFATFLIFLACSLIVFPVLLTNSCARSFSLAFSVPFFWVGMDEDVDDVLILYIL